MRGISRWFNYLSIEQFVDSIDALCRSICRRLGIRRISLRLKRLTIEQLVELIDEPHRSICRRILEENRQLFEVARGSTHNHQAWEGGYIDHVTECMNIALYLYPFLAGFGRPLPFSLSDTLVVLFHHDIEKPWRITIENGEVKNRPGLSTKEEFQQFRESKLRAYGIVLSEAQHNALTYVEGEFKAYSSLHRVSNELAAFCHMVDTWSARGWYDHPLVQGDPWTGARRVRTS